MRGRVTKTRACCPGSRLSQEKKQPDAVARSSADLPSSSREQPPVSGDLVRDEAAAVPTKKKLDATSVAGPLSPKRARSIRTDVQRPGVANETSKQTDKTALQQPKPGPPKAPYAVSLES
ncbi:hypothetical protein EDB81DRAFT_28850 [Dactylonectria macrodidyma]|uniref:Uncharacterized protein n=1 Tax=Dactylonectria macrodidyma TaxID=307937 RepID=A0A9P9JIT1_9HYPO|nr:hypothetical protein EDB81DRAFT_28850 [Dactylonectria macrodidyma]